jgi:hypothetical protein
VFRLNQKAFNILTAEIEKTAAQDSIAGEVAQKIALKRLNKLREREGKPVTAAELKELLSDILPDFNYRTIAKAVEVNRSPSSLWLMPKIAVGLISIAGFIWLLNLPYPMIRRPVARIAPILLLPSYISMDDNYRKAVTLVEQADQLINQATSMADLELGTEKVQQAQKHLDALPVWFIGYEPRVFRTWFHHGFLFTLDEFKAARATVGRMEAKVFQEKNAMNQLQQSEVLIERAKQDYQQANNSVAKQEAIALWQTGIDQLTQLPPSTLAGNVATTKLNAYRRDFEKVIDIY